MADTGQTDPTALRQRLIERIAARLLDRTRPRLVICGILLLAATAGFLTSAGLLSVGAVSMGLRYAVATLIAYAAFLAGVRVWIKSAGRRLVHEIAHTVEPALPDPPGRESRGALGVDEVVDGLLQLGMNDPDLVAPGIALLLLGIALVSGAVAAVVVVIGAPSLLAEALLDIAVAATAYRRLQEIARQNWVEGVLRRTWKPALAILLVATVGGIVLQSLNPGIESVGDIWRR